MSKSNALIVLVAAAVAGGVIGVGWVSVEPQGRQVISEVVKDAAVSAGIQRQRPPRHNDMWGGCNDARAAGTAPIYRGEPGYREDMDGDGDGIACEPYP